MGRRRVVILGAAGRDFHDFNVVYRADPSVEVVAFTATQIPGIAGRLYPPSLAGPHHPQGIPIVPQSSLEALCAEGRVDEVVFAYSDVAHEEVMHLASRVLATGADFVLLGPSRTMLRAKRPVLAVSAVRTGCGKSQVSLWISRRIAAAGWRCGVIRHPMPYGDLARQAVQRFASAVDLDAADCTNEEREEYEPHLEAGNVVFAGVDYAAILALAEAEAEVLIWEGGNNDFPFLRPDLHVALVDALRPDQVTTHHPGEAVVRMADVVIVNKVDAAPAAALSRAIDAVRVANPRAAVLRAASPVLLDDPAAVRGRRVVVVEDGPTITHGGMAFGAGLMAAEAAGAAIVDPRPHAAPALGAVYARYPHIGPVVPAVGYDEPQLAALRETLEAAGADAIVSATPFDLAGRLRLCTPVVRARYAYAELDEPGLGAVVDRFLSGVRPSAWGAERGGGD